MEVQGDTTPWKVIQYILSVIFKRLKIMEDYFRVSDWIAFTGLHSWIQRCEVMIMYFLTLSNFVV